MKKVFISQPMNGLTDSQIFDKREEIIKELHEIYGSANILVMNTYINEDAPAESNPGLWYLGKSLQILAEADLAVFAEGWKNARGCRIEHECAKEYGISIVMD